MHMHKPEAAPGLPLLELLSTSCSLLPPRDDLIKRDAHLLSTPVKGHRAYIIIRIASGLHGLCERHVACMADSAGRPYRS